VPWDTARAAWQRCCTCDAEPFGGLRCPLCGGARRDSLGPAQLQVCRWCGSAVSRACNACGRGLHFRGECGRWRRGAERLYDITPVEDRYLCPDCAWDWVRELRAVPGSLPEDHVAAVATHMSELASHCSPGAGSRVHAAPRCGGGGLRQWVRRFLQRHSWTRVRRLCRIADADCGQRVRGPRSAIPSRVRQILRELHRAGLVVVDGDRSRVAVCWASLAVGGQRVSRPGRRRRRLPPGTGVESPARRRRGRSPGPASV
jgi:hypothetical protein